MMKSMFSGVSGLKAHQVRMDVIGNNIANVNTVGYKSSKLNFSEIYSQTLRGAGTATAGVGGTNPMQVGLGVTVGSIDVNHAKGSIQRTDSATDLMIDGSGFFVVSNDASAQNRFYTRAGNFTLDSNGNLVTSNGYKVLDKDGKPVVIDKSKIKPAEATETITIKANLNINEDYFKDATRYNKDINTDFSVFDSLGRTHKLQTVFSKEVYVDPADTTITYRTIDIKDDNGTSVVDPAPVDPNKYFVKFSATGEMMGIVTGDLTDPAVATLSATPTDLTGATIKLTPVGASPITIPLENDAFKVDGKFALSQTAQDTDVRAMPNEGLAPGTMESYSISSSGDIVAVYTNGLKDTLTTLGLVIFDNPAGLMKLGANLFGETVNSGNPFLGRPNSGAFGAIAPGALEMSNVDLSQEFTDMITTQRGFQANSRIITTTDEMLQELVNLKR